MRLAGIANTSTGQTARGVSDLGMAPITDGRLLPHCARPPEHYVTLTAVLDRVFLWVKTALVVQWFVPWAALSGRGAMALAPAQHQRTQQVVACRSRGTTHIAWPHLWPQGGVRYAHPQTGLRLKPRETYASPADRRQARGHTASGAVYSRSHALPFLFYFARARYSVIRPRLLGRASDSNRISISAALESTIRLWDPRTMPE